MIVSTKGRYALRVMVNLAQHGQEDYIPLKEIAESEGISQKYLETIMTVLSKAGFVDAVHGKGGGYRLNRQPEGYTVGGILKLTATEAVKLVGKFSAHMRALPENEPEEPDEEITLPDPQQQAQANQALVNALFTAVRQWLEVNEGNVSE